MNKFLPDFIFKIIYKRLFIRFEDEKEYIEGRVDYYFRVKTSFSLSSEVASIKDINPREYPSAYYFDMLQFCRFFPNARFDYLFGDITHVPDTPSFLKSRPISEDNQNSVLLKLNKVRHFNFINDSLDYEDKKDMIVWRGKSFVTHHRFEVCGKYFDSPQCNIGLSNPAKKTYEKHLTRGRLTIDEQLKYKFILSMEGNDVATNLKWIMSSNSLCFMRKPRFETWFMEGRLIPDVHYVELKDDFSDLLEKVDFYIENPNLAKNIINNAHDYVEQFFDEDRELLISLLVMKKYLELSGQVD
ncbi:glycosyl transferase family 90 [Marinomonas ushuaiensis]|nr:glycosyl transferase family 90 [Marinomonas ushuaiensis]